MTRLPEGVGWTALLAAYGRAQESRAAARLFDDPLASMFVAAVTDAGVSLLATITGLSAPGSRFAGEYFSGPWRESYVETFDQQERAAWNLVRQAFRYGPAGVAPADWLTGRR